MNHTRTGEQAFIRMMHDCVTSNHNKDATTERLKQTVERHLMLALDLARAGKMDWFFDQWVYETEGRSHEVEYSINEIDESKAHPQSRITQLGVSDSFLIAVPMRARYQGKPVLLGTVKMAKTSAPLDISITLPWIPDELVLNSFHHVLAQDVTVKRR